MIPCHVCGKEALGGWVIGFPPAPDSQKLGLCRMHNNKENRRIIAEEWQKMFEGAIETENLRASMKAGAQSRLLTIHFIAGGAISMPCSAIKVNEQGSLQVRSGEETLFFPMAQVRNYSLTPAALAPALPQTPQP